MRRARRKHQGSWKRIRQFLAITHKLTIAIMVWVLLPPAASGQDTAPFTSSANDPMVDALATHPGAGDLDTSFGGDGIVLTDFGHRGDTALAIAIQPDGKIVVAGGSTDASGNNTDFALARYLPDGTPDLTFSGDAKVRTNFGAADFAGGLALQPDGKIVVAGPTVDVTTLNGDFAVARYLPNGTLDAAFNGNGRVITDLGADDRAAALALQPDGKIVVVGGSQDGGDLDFALVRYLPNGSLDLDFGAGGIVISDFSTFDRADAVMLQEDGKIVVAGVIDDDVGVARYFPNGTLDGTFNGTGWVTTDFVASDQATAAALQSDGKIVVAGLTISGQASLLARYRPNGTLDPTFGEHGKVLLDFMSFRRNQTFAVALQQDGKIVIAGSANFTGGKLHFALARYLSDGTLDASFSHDGKVRTNFAGAAEALALAIQPNDGRLVVTGYTTTSGSGFANRDFALARYHAITCNGVAVTRIGTAGNDTIIGTSGTDVIYGFSGNDFIDGRGDNDIICGGTGDDTLLGGGGDDILRGGPGSDVCRGGPHIVGDRVTDCEVVNGVP